jgi:hypothetical protein
MLQKFYWSTTRKAVVAFGNIFNQITIDRKDETGGVVQSIRVPLGYAPKQKFLARIDEIVNSDRPFEVLVPRMAFEMIGIEYDSSRKINILHQNRKLESNQAALQQYSPVPYNIAMSLYVYAKNQDDGLQIVEQIMPYFNPDFNLSLKAMPQLDINHDLQIVLNSLSYEDSYEGDFRDRRMIIWTLNFTIKMNYFGPVNRQGVIKKAIADIQTYGSNVNQGRFDYTATVDPFSAGPDDVYTIIETFDEF